ncbi:MAG: hypothetical protein U0797_04390 [Gemmataceae bacterium]
MTLTNLLRRVGHEVALKAHLRLSWRHWRAGGAPPASSSTRLSAGPAVSSLPNAMMLGGTQTVVQPDGIRS